MRIINTLILVMLSLATFAQLKPKVVIVIADGIPADVIERLRPPAMQQIIKEGAYTRAHVGGTKGTYTETPTISAPGYNDMLTGTWGYKHNVWDNDNQHPNYNYPTIFRIFKTAKPTGTTAIFSTWVQNRKMLLGTGLPQTGNLSVDYVYDGYEKDTIAFPHDKASLYLHHIDEHVSKLLQIQLSGQKRRTCHGSTLNIQMMLAMLKAPGRNLIKPLACWMSK
jgi:hypothetical protein